MTARRTLLFLLFCVLWSITAARAGDPALLKFKIKDQFDRVYTERSWDTQVIIVLGADRKGNKFSSPWGKALSDSLARSGERRRATLIGLADLRGVPFFLKGLVRSKFPEDKKRWVLLDWKGRFPKAYNFVPGRCNILVFGERRTLTLHAAVDEVETQQMSRILATIRAEITRREPESPFK